MRNLREEKKFMIKFHEIHETKKAVYIVFEHLQYGKSYLHHKSILNSSMLINMKMSI